jgi:hypothetical protein
MRELLWLQLGFDLAMLLALLALLRRRPREAAPGSSSAAPSAGLDELVERAERQELAAEAALRRRLTRFREAAG